MEITNKVYLMQEEGTNNFKIGFTSKDLKTRKSGVQTGNSNNVYLIHFFETKVPGRKLELSLHAYFKLKRKKGEWFILEKSDVDNFIEVCKKLESNLLFLIKSGNQFCL